MTIAERQIVDADAGGPPLDPFGLTSEQFVEHAAGHGMSRGQALRAYRQVFRLGPERCGAVLSKRATALLGPSLATGGVAPIVRSHEEPTPEGVVSKFCQRLDFARVGRPDKGPIARDDRVEHLDIESVIIPMISPSGKRTYTLCVSSQVGCAMGCGFCETAQMGLVRNLTAAEIVGQWVAATFLAEHPMTEPDGRRGAEPVLPGARRRINNIVFMGMGEPLDNFDAVSQAIRVLADDNGPGVGASNITVSTVGRVDGIRKLSALVKEEGFHKLGLAISVNAPNDTVRDELMPVNRGMPMAMLRESLLEFPYRARTKLCFEYVLIPGVNDSRLHASQLAEWLTPFKSDSEDPVPRGLLNLIPYNPRRDSPWPAPTEDGVEQFMGWLIEEGVFVKRRRTKGRSQMAACGQLGTAEIRGRKFVGLTASAAEG